VRHAFNGDDRLVRDTDVLLEAEQWATGISGPASAIDDETAIKVVDGTVEVVSEGHWRLLSS
jgi:dipeptidase E